MKRFIVSILLVALIAPMMIFAAVDADSMNPEKNPVLSVVSSYDMPLTARAKGMGGAGIALPGRADSFFMNPAGFAKRIAVLLPSVEISLYHPYDLLKPGKDGSIVDKILDATTIENQDEKMAAMTGAAQSFLQSLKKGPGKLMDLNVSTAFDFAGFAFGLNVNDSVHTFGLGKTGGLDSAFFNELNITANVGLGLRFHVTDDFWIDAGANWRPTYKAYSSYIDGNAILGMLSSSEVNPQDMIANQIPLAAGFALPFDLGLNFSGSWWSVGIVGRNIIGNYNMKTFENLTEFAPAWSEAFKGKDFKIKTPWSIDAGFAFQWDNVWFKPTFACDIVDINGMFTAEKFDGREFMRHLKVGAEMRLLSFLDVRGGFSEGYWSVGAGLDLAILKVDIAYYWQEFGKQLGDYGLDAVSVRVNIGWDR